MLCNHCQNHFAVTPGPSRCPICGKLVTAIRLGPESLARIDAMVQFKALQQQTGQLGTRKQDSYNDDSNIDRDGMEAESVACMALCPSRVPEWFETRGPNRGIDLLAEWIGLPKPTEIKQTRYLHGHLLIRPPKGAGYAMKEEYVDDSIYILVTGPNSTTDRTYTLRGWTDRSHFLSHVNKSPTGRVYPGSGKLECWGVRVNKLLSMESLFPESLFPVQVGKELL